MDQTKPYFSGKGRYLTLYNWYLHMPKLFENHSGVTRTFSFTDNVSTFQNGSVPRCLPGLPVTVVQLIARNKSHLVGKY